MTDYRQVLIEIRNLTENMDYEDGDEFDAYQRAVDEIRTKTYEAINAEPAVATIEIVVDDNGLHCLTKAEDFPIGIRVHVVNESDGEVYDEETFGRPYHERLPSY